jgi:hypothetical protein
VNNKIAGLSAAAIAVLSLGLGGRAGAQNIEILPPEAPPPRSAPETPPEVTPAPPPEATPGTPPEAPPPEAPATAPPEAGAAPPAAAPAFGDAWHYAISIERAAGYDHISQTQSFYGQDSKTTATNFTLFGTPTTGALAAFSFPRAAFDLFLAQDFSVGLGLGLLYGSTTATPNGGSSTEQSFTGLLAAPRVGYALNLAPDVTLWARAGISVVYARVNPGAAYATGPASSHLVAATIELPVVFTILPRLALTAGPTLDVTFNGHLTRPGFGDGGVPSYDEHVTELGIQGGVLVYF